MTRTPLPALALAAAALIVLLAPTLRGQTDEIQVYNATIAEPGELTLTLHNNYTAAGGRDPAYPGAVPAYHALNGVPEFGYGAFPWLELGMYLPVYSVLPGGHYLVESAKLRALFVVPDADKRRFFYGVNFELSRNAARWEEHSPSGEVRPIFGVRHGAVALIVNPIFDTGFNGFSRLDFAPCERLEWTVSQKWTLAAEHYADYGPVDHLLPSREQLHELFAVVDFNGSTSVELGLGYRLTPAAARWTVKLMLDWSVLHPRHTE